MPILVCPLPIGRIGTDPIWPGYFSPFSSWLSFQARPMTLHTWDVRERSICFDSFDTCKSSRKISDAFVLLSCVFSFLHQTFWASSCSSYCSSLCTLGSPLLKVVYLSSLCSLLLLAFLLWRSPISFRRCQWLSGLDSSRLLVPISWPSRRPLVDYRSLRRLCLQRPFASFAC